jgi:hypothetical protein
MSAVALSPQHRYVTVLGSCCTGEGIASTGFHAISEAKLRLVLYQGRTSFFSMSTGPLLEHEFQYTNEAEKAPQTEWGFRMVLDETRKAHERRLSEVMRLSDALIVDNVAAFIFPALCDRSQTRFFLKSWEWEKYIMPCIALDQCALWDLPIELSLLSLRQLLGSFYTVQPSLSVIFHIPLPCFNDGIKFSDPAVMAHVDYYEEYCDRTFEEACHNFPRVSAVSPSSAQADPTHPSGPNPFRFEKSYSNWLRKEVEDRLGT